MKIAKMYGMIAPNQSTTQTVRNVFFIDPSQKIRAILQYPMSAGRNINEILRLLDAMQIFDKEKNVTPANWVPGNPTIVPAPTTYDGLVERLNNPNGFNCVDWYLCFNQTNDALNNMNDRYYPMQNKINYNSYSINNKSIQPNI